MHQPLAGPGRFKAGDVCAGEASDKCGSPVFAAEADIGRSPDYRALRVFEIHFQIPLRIDKADGVGRGKRHPEITRFVKRDTVGKAQFSQKVRPVNFSGTQLVSIEDAVTQNAPFHCFRHIGILLSGSDGHAVCKSDTGRDNARRFVW